MNLTNVSFWSVRAALWPTRLRRHAPFVRPSDDPLDLEVATLLRDLKLTPHNAEANAYRSLAEAPWHQPLAQLVGDRFAPYAEMRRFWVPAAVAYAKWQDEQQRAILPSLNQNIRGLAQACRRIETAFGFIKNLNVRALGDAWSQSPSRPFNARSLELENARGQFVLDLEDALTFHLGQLKQLLPSEEADFHGGTDFCARAFVLILAIAYHRLARNHPTMKELDAFVYAVQTTVWPNAEAVPMDKAIQAIVQDETELGSLARLSPFLRFCGEAFWDRLTPPNDPHAPQTGFDLVGAILDDIIVPENMKSNWGPGAPIVVD